MGMSYTHPMRSTRPSGHPFFSSSFIVSGGRGGFPFIPGVTLLALGLVLLMAPRLLLAAVAFCLLVFGALLCVVAYKFISLRKQIDQLAKSMEGSLFTASFKRPKPDIDVTESESSKIIYH